MEYRDERLGEIGARIHDLLAVDPEANEELRRGRIALLEEVARRNAASGLRRSSRAAIRHPWLPLVFAASCAAGAAGVWLWTRPVSFQVGETRVGQLGDVVEGADGKVSTPLHFSDGSTVLLHEGGRLRVLSLKSGAARVLVEDGVIDATIAHRKLSKTKWDFEAGPYRVTVNGTRFRMAFHASDDSFSLSTQEGQVVVSGGCQKTPKTVSAGERMELSCAPREAAATPAPRPWVDGAPALEMPPAAPERELASGRTTRNHRWRELLAAGQLSQGLNAAEHAGFERVCQAATVKELLALADAGRFFGSTMRAATALRVLRQRFPGSTDAGTAAFTLGRLAFEKQHEYAEAAAWFEVYLREQPSGPLMGDAFGRLMEARMRSGDHDGARAGARQYLRRFPEGPYASEARGVLSR